ncbi:uncharacterized protein LOC142344586 isoform X1 [Convolutriloba macropyga]|uniref:uncharacterized protein LOC142344586 isoform X1 n=1 Tax=Convolutriloba macropyga TaxID=536237 RepID=UPI003F51D53A
MNCLTSRTRAICPTFDMSCNGTENATPSSDQDSPSPESEHAKQIPPPTNNKSNHLPSDQTSNGQLPKDDNQKHNQLDNLQNGDVSLPRDSILRAKTHSFNPLLAEPNYMNGNNHQLSITSMEDDPNRARKINLVRHLLRHEADPGVPSLTELQQRRRSSVFRFNRQLNFRRKKKTRLFNKSGSTNAKFINIKHRGHRFMADIFTTVVDMKWRWLMLIFILAFNFTWALFGFFWWLIMYFHEDFDHFDDPIGGVGGAGGSEEEWDFCLKNTRSYVGAFLFSLETQTTIGYGYRVISEKCSEGIILLIIQSILAAFFESVLIGMVLAKASRAKKRAETVVFSKMACIGVYDGHLHFSARVGDIRNNSFLVEAHVRMYLIKSKLSEDHDYNPIEFYDMDVGYDSGFDRIMIIAPILLRHKIAEHSPLYSYSKSTFSRHDFEIVVIVEGAVEQTGMTTQMRTSYTPDEILWGHYFKQMIQRERGQYVVNFGLFDAVYEHETLPYSAEDLDRLQNGESPEEEIPLEQENNNNNSPSNKDNNSNGGVGTGNDKKHLNTIRFRVTSVAEPSLSPTNQAGQSTNANSNISPVKQPQTTDNTNQATNPNSANGDLARPPMPSSLNAIQNGPNNIKLPLIGQNPSQSKETRESVSTTPMGTPSFLHTHAPSNLAALETTNSPNNRRSPTNLVPDNTQSTNPLNRGINRDDDSRNSSESSTTAQHTNTSSAFTNSTDVNA